MRTIYSYQAYLVRLLSRLSWLRQPVRVYAYPTSPDHTQGLIGSGSHFFAQPEDFQWALVNGATFSFNEDVQVVAGTLYVAAYSYQYMELDNEGNRGFFFRFDLEDIPVTRSKPQPHLHVAGVRPDAHKIHFPSPRLTLPLVLDLIESQVL